MVDLSVRHLVKAFEVKKNILDGISFEVNQGERVGLLGRNGVGKTTLFRLLVGELTEDEGDIVIPAGKRIGLISQIPVYPEGYTAEDVLRTAFRRLDEMQARMEQLTGAMAAGDSGALAEYDRLSARFQQLGGYQTEVELAKVANGLDIPLSMRQQPFSALSGGEKTRVNLARLILEDTDILLLDEPTNHLDMRATQWLEDYLLHFRGTVLAISHDRYFLDRIATRTIEIVNGKAEFYSGNYSFYLVERQRRYEEKLKAWEKSQKEIAHLQQAADDLHLWAFMGADKLHKRAFSMEKRIERLQKNERPTRERKMNVRFGEKEFYADEVLVADKLSKRFGERTLFRDLSLEIGGQERVALIGDNGTGKSTLLKILMGELEPDSGYVRTGPSVRTAVLPQIIRFDDPTRDLVDTLLWDSRCTPQEARDRLAAFRFVGEDVFKPVGMLSGGEQSRLRLCMLMKDDVNLLVLDEPTNHLDINSREWIEEALEDYREALLFVSHDRYFIEKFATRIWALSPEGLVDFRGGWSAYQAYCEKQAAITQTQRNIQRKKEPKKARGEPTPEKQLAKAERDIAKAEEGIALLDAEIEANAADYVKLMELTAVRETAQAELDELYLRWETLSEAAEKQ